MAVFLQRDQDWYAISGHNLQTCLRVAVRFCYLTTLWFLLFNYRLYFCFFPSTFSLQTLYLDMVRQDLQQPKLSSNINMMPSNCSRCTHNIQENDRLTARIAVLQAQHQTQSLGKGNFSVGKDETASVPPVSIDSSINPLARSPQPENFLTASGRKCCRNAQPVSLIQPTETFNRFSPLSSESESEAEPSLVSTPLVTGSETPKLPTISSDKLKTLVIGNSITRSIRLKSNHPAIIHCLPGGRATDVKANLKMVLAKAKTGECREYRDIVIHVGTNDVRMKQSEITKRNIASACKSASVSGPLPVRGSDELYSRVSQLNRWLKTVYCPSQKIEFVDNWPSFWDSPTNRTKPDLLRSDGLHPSWRGALILSTNIDRALTPLAPQ
uniref:SGNH hydrolase-type esterase domain-containing protein n=1 Tax=Oncorhynchus mykiss TaxID=8022 RepID=A0A8C7QG66_ONCMY